MTRKSRDEPNRGGHPVKRTKKHTSITPYLPPGCCQPLRPTVEATRSATNESANGRTDGRRLLTPY